MSVELRDALPGDGPVILDLVNRVLSEYDLTTDPAGTDADVLDLERAYAGGVFKVLVNAGAIVGSYGVFRVSADTCELRKMYLLSEYRGLGLGRKMLEDAFASARALGFTTMILETHHRLAEAIALYRRNGFEEYEPEHLSTRCNRGMRRGL